MQTIVKNPKDFIEPILYSSGNEKMSIKEVNWREVLKPFRAPPSIDYKDFTFLFWIFAILPGWGWAIYGGFLVSLPLTYELASRLFWEHNITNEIIPIIICLSLGIVTIVAGFISFKKEQLGEDKYSELCTELLTFSIEDLEEQCWKLSHKPESRILVYLYDGEEVFTRRSPVSNIGYVYRSTREIFRGNIDESKISAVEVSQVDLLILLNQLRNNESLKMEE